MCTDTIQSVCIPFFLDNQATRLQAWPARLVIVVNSSDKWYGVHCKPPGLNIILSICIAIACISTSSYTKISIEIGHH